MKLRTSATSPYVRKVWILARETGLAERIEPVPTNAWDPATDLPADNPLGKVPTLLTEGGEALYDSPVICDYLDSLHDGPKLIPAAGGPRWVQKRLEALADGLLDAALAVRAETTLRPADKLWPDWVERQQRAIARALDRLEDEAPGWGETFLLGQIAVVAALGYLDFRFPESDWRAGRPALAAWFARVSLRPSVAATVPA
ncbi:glutathione S-transferase N-terminal domain-containing protein [Phaeospirillum tilakii]|uniref:Glutathione S-transferase N-terminal domain-containing protein n=1 Tax=Phaeospirillum tilakii TaxID=741673 RepID=A0ABW5CCW0_9PROT